MGINKCIRPDDSMTCLDTTDCSLQFGGELLHQERESKYLEGFFTGDLKMESEIGSLMQH